MKRVVGPASPMLRSAAAAAAFATLYYLTADLTSSIVGDPGIAVLWPASGVYLGVMLVAPRHMWPALTCAAGVGSLAAYLHGGSSIELSVAFAVPSSAEGLLGALLVERIAGKRFRLGGLRDLIALVVGGAVVANALVALSAAAVAAQSFDASLAESWLRWWSADALGVLAVAPVITAVRLRPEGRRSRTAELRPAACVLAGVGCAIYFTLSAEPAATATLVGGAIAFPFLLWAGWRWGLRPAALGGLSVALAATHVASQIYLAQGFLAVLLMGSLAFAAVVADRGRLRLAADRASRELESTAEQLEGAGRRIAQLTAELAARRAELHETAGRRERLTDDFRDSQAARGRTEQELADARDELARARTESRTLEGELARARTESRALEGELSRAAMESRALEEEIERGRAEQARASEALDEAVSARGRAEQERELVSRRLDGVLGELQLARREHTQSEQALDHARERFAEQRERLERSLEEANQSVARAEAHRSRLGHVTDMSSRYDDRGTCLYASPAFCRLLGYEPGELVGRPGAELLHPDDRPRLARARAMRSQSTFEGRLRGKGGEFVWVEVTLDPVVAWRDGRLVELGTTVRDISAQRAPGQSMAARHDAYAAR